METARKVGGLYVIVDAQVAQGRDLVESEPLSSPGGRPGHTAAGQAPRQGRCSTSCPRYPRALCDRHNAILIINDHADLAVACNAHGLHLGRHDLPVGEARAILHPHQIIGTSSALLEEALESERQGADYLAVGAIFPTDTKEKTRPAGLETLERVRRRVPRFHWLPLEASKRTTSCRLCRREPTPRASSPQSSATLTPRKPPNA